ncbi:NADH-quinone oxidoreductase subunit N [Desulfurobacterium crinifex]
MNLNLELMLPETFLLISALLMIVIDLVISDRQKNSFFSNLSIVVIVVTMFLISGTVSVKPSYAFNGFIKKDLMVVLSQLLLLISGIFAVLLSHNYIEKFSLKYKGEYYYTLLFALLGGMLLVAANEFSTLFVSLEVMSISVYILVALFKNDYRGKEAALKYFIMGSVGAAILVYGFAILYGLTGVTTYDGVSELVNKNGVTLALLFSIALVAVAFLFKTGAVPFHAWVPDVYHGAPTPITTFMGAAVKVASFVAFLRLFFPVFVSFAKDWTPAIELIAVVTMFAGALLALNQNNLKRMLAYSAVSHTGVILAAFVTVPALASFVVLFYLFVYVFMTLAAFGMISLLTTKGLKGENVEDWSGLYKKSPFLALSAVVIFMSLAGIPPLAGFWAKFYLLVALLREGFITLALAVVLSSLMSLYFYLKPLVYAFMKGESDLAVSYNVRDYAVIGLSTLAILIIGFFPNLFVKFSLLGVISFVRGLI